MTKNQSEIEEKRKEFDRWTERNYNSLSSPAVVREALTLERMLYRNMEKK